MYLCGAVHCGNSKWTPRYRSHTESPVACSRQRQNFRLTSTQNKFQSLFDKMGFLCFARRAFASAGFLGVYARKNTRRYVCVPGVWGRAGMRVNKYSKDETLRDVSAQFACYQLPHRSIVKLQGQDTSPFLQGLITNDIGLLEEPGHAAMYAHMLNVQGRTLYDIILYRCARLYCCLCTCGFCERRGYLTRQLLIDTSGKEPWFLSVDIFL